MGKIKFRYPVLTCFPDEVSNAFVDIVVPCLYFHTNASVEDIITGERFGPIAVYVVKQTDVMVAMRMKDPVVEKYFNHIGFPKTQNATFGFSPRDIEVIRTPKCISVFPSQA